MRSEATAGYPLETGGVLVGFTSEDQRRLVISAASGPGPRAKHETWRFTPDAEFQSDFVRRHYEVSNRVHSYLGDWHTHPGGVAKLSRIDQCTLRRIAKDKEARATKPVMAILAGGPDDWDLAIWQMISARWWRPSVESNIVLEDGS